MVFWLPLLLAAGQAAGQADAARRNQKATNAAQRRFERLNTLFANQDLAQSYVAIAARRIQERHQIAQSIDQVSLDATRRIGSVSVASGESGVHGHSSAALVNDFKIQQLKSETALMDTEKYMQEQYQRDVDAARAQATSRILGGQQQRVPQPDYAQIFLNGVTNYVQWSAGMRQAAKLPYGDPGGGGGGATVNLNGGFPNQPGAGSMVPPPLY